MRKHKMLIIITSLLTLLPLFAGLLLWNRLPDRIATHFGLDGTPNGWSSKGFTVFGLPAILLGCHLFCAFVTALDPKGKNISDRAYCCILWIVPAASLFCGYSTYSDALEWPGGIPIERGVYLFLGILLLILGNYLPKSGQNYTVGIKLPWTLASEENWNKTHRLAGWVFVIGGLVSILNMFLQQHWLMTAVLAATILIPTGYSLGLYLAEKKK